MAIEAKRGCGFRKIHGLYMVADGLSAACDRLPIEIGACPVCNSGLHFTRGMTQINALRLWGRHKDCHDSQLIRLQCVCCNPTDAPAFLMGVGVKYYPTPQDFIAEGVKQGVSKRISRIPRNFKLGETWIYLVHPKAVLVKENVLSAAASVIADSSQASGVQPRLVDAEKKPEYKPGVFTAFRPQRIEKLIWQHEATEETLKALEKRGITPIIVPDGDKDHK